MCVCVGRLCSFLQFVFFSWSGYHRYLHVRTHSFPSRRSSDLFDRFRSLSLGAAVDRGRRCRADRPDDRGREAARATLGQRQYGVGRSEEHTSELQSLMRTSYAVFCLKKKNQQTNLYKLYSTKRSITYNIRAL